MKQFVVWLMHANEQTAGSMDRLCKHFLFYKVA